jgi:DsbC/DsbD-like thiol-disulfide interchange protein
MEFRSADPTFIGTIDAVFESKAITLMRTARAAVPALAVALALFGRASIVVAEPVQTGHVTAELVAEQDALVPGTTATVALRLAIEPGWHTYWRNPGESGLPTTLDWRLPQGYAAGAIAWPAPRALPAGPLVNYGYEGEVFHLVPLTVPADAKEGTPATLAARAEWLVCKETCIPEGADIRLTLPVAAHARVDSRWGSRIASTRDALPRAAPAAWKAQATASGATIALQFAAGDESQRRVSFFADREREIEPSAPQTVAQRDGRIDLTLPVSHELAPGFSRLQGVLTADPGFRVDGRVVNAGGARRRCHRNACSRPQARTGRYCDGFLGVDVRGRAVVAACARIRARRRTAAEPDALCFPGAVAEGAGTGRIGCAQAALRCAAKASRSRPASSSRSCCWALRSSDCAPPASSSGGASSCNLLRSSARWRCCSS